MAIYVVGEEFTLVRRAVGPREMALSGLQAVTVLTSEIGTVRPGLLPRTVLLVLLPFTFILWATGVGVDAAAVCLVIFPLTLIDIAVGVLELASAVCHIFLPLPM